MAMNNNPLSDTFEQINQATGGIPQDLVDQGKDVVGAATVDVVKGMAKAPLDALVDLIGGGSGGNTGNSNISETNESANSSSGNQVTNQQNDQNDDLQSKIDAARQEQQTKLTRAREVLADFEQQFQQTKQEEEMRKQEEAQEEAQKQQVRQIEEKKKDNIAIQQAQLQHGGSGEVTKLAG
jgi:hypothetical protein